MNKDLLIRILGKENAIKFDDEVYNLRLIVEDLQPFTILKKSLPEDESHDFIEKLIIISITINIISKQLDSVENYTNSKNYLKKYIDGIYLHSNEICNALKSKSIEDLTYHRNCLADLVLSY